MADVTRRRTGELLRKLFEILMAVPDEVRAQDALAMLANAVELTEYEAGNYPTGGRRFEKNVRFSTVDTVKAGWLLKNNGHWSVTDAGRSAYKKFQVPEAFYKEAVRLYREWKLSQPQDADAEVLVDADELGSDGAAREFTLTYELADEQAWAEIERFLIFVNTRWDNTLRFLGSRRIHRRKLRMTSGTGICPDELDRRRRFCRPRRPAGLTATGVTSSKKSA